MCSAKQLYCVTATHVEKMAANCTVSATLADPETLEEITLNDKEFLVLLQMRKSRFLMLLPGKVRTSICHQTKMRRPWNTLQGD